MRTAGLFNIITHLIIVEYNTLVRYTKGYSLSSQNMFSKLYRKLSSQLLKETINVPNGEYYYVMMCMSLPDRIEDHNRLFVSNLLGKYPQDATYDITISALA